MAKKKLILDESQSQNISVLGLVTAETDIRTCWNINKATGLNIALNLPQTIVRSAKEISFTRYSYEDEYCKYFLFKNYNGKDILFSELKRIDYVFIVQGDISQFDLNKLHQQLKDIQEIEAAIGVDIQEIKSLKKISL